jgi:hypothetical protein
MRSDISHRRATSLLNQLLRFCSLFVIHPYHARNNHLESLRRFSTTGHSCCKQPPNSLLSSWSIHKHAKLVDAHVKSSISVEIHWCYNVLTNDEPRNIYYRREILTAHVGMPSINSYKTAELLVEFWAAVKEDDEASANTIHSCPYFMVDSYAW